MKIKSKKEFKEYFKEIYGREPSAIELKAFIECMQAIKDKKEE